jgi:formylglycine-generating enzyme required for sulfatase activity
MKRNTKKWIVAAVVLVLVCIFGGFFFKDQLYELFNPAFDETTIFPDENRTAPVDTTFTVNGIEIKMIGIKGGKINCEGLRETLDIKDFYIAETEVTQELWTSIMGYNPSSHLDSTLCPVEGVDLLQCLDFVHKLDSVSGVKFYLQTYPEWLYVAYLAKDTDAADCLDSMSWYKENADSTTHPVKQKKPNSLGVYDMIGNVSEWTISGSDPLFFVMGGSFNTKKESCKKDINEFYHAKIQSQETGLRLVCYPKDSGK